MSEIRKLLESLGFESSIEQRIKEIEETYAELDRLGEEINAALPSPNSKQEIAEHEQMWEDYSNECLKISQRLNEDAHTILQNNLDDMEPQQALSDYEAYLDNLDQRYAGFQTIAETNRKKYGATDATKEGFWGYIAILWRGQQQEARAQAYFVQKLTKLITDATASAQSSFTPPKETPEQAQQRQIATAKQQWNAAKTLPKDKGY